MQNLGFALEAETENPTKTTCALKHEVDVQICQNVIGPATLDFVLSAFSQGIAWFFIPAARCSKVITRPPGGPTPVRSKAKFKNSTTFAEAMQHLGLRSGSRNRKTHKNPRAPHVSKSENPMEPAEPDFRYSAQGQAFRGFFESGLKTTLA